MKNPFKDYKFKEETDREMILEYFQLLYKEKSDIFPTLKLLMIFKAFKAIVPDFDMALDEFKTHLDALAEAPEGRLMKKKDEYYMGD